MKQCVDVAIRERFADSRIGLRVRRWFWFNTISSEHRTKGDEDLRKRRNFGERVYKTFA